jgi:hypothetical protein
VCAKHTPAPRNKSALKTPCAHFVRAVSSRTE